MRNRNFAMVSAFRLELPAEENESNHKALSDGIASAGLTVIRILAQFEFDDGGYDEKGFFVVGKGLERRGGSGQILGLRKLAFRLGQKAILIRVASENAFVHAAYGETFDMGSIQSDNLADFYFKARGFEHSGFCKDIEFWLPPTFFDRIRKTYSASVLYYSYIKSDEAARGNLRNCSHR